MPNAYNVYSPYEYFQLYVGRNIIDNITEKKNLYSVQKFGNSINTTSKEIEQFFGINNMYVHYIY